MKIALVAGGTGGHIFPAIALGQALQDLGHEIIYIGNRTLMEAKIVANQTSFTFCGIDNEGLNPGIMGKVKGVLSQFKAIYQSYSILKQQKFEFMISFGGYVTFPVAVVCQWKKIPYFIHEQNAIAGKSNLLIQKQAKWIFTCYNHVLSQFSNPKKSNEGNPRETIVSQALAQSNVTNRYPFDKNNKIIYVVMGSLGAQTFSEVFIELLNRHHFEGVEFVVSTGRYQQLYEETLSATNTNKVHLYEFVDQVEMLVAADFVISRAGATSIAEIVASHTPSLLIPSPYVVKNHQFYNAKEIHEHKACLMLLEADLSIDTLKQAIDCVYQEEVLNKLKQNCMTIAKPHAISNMIEKIQNEINYHF